MQHLLDEAPGSRIWFHQQQNMHAKSKERSELEVSTTVMSSEMNNFLFLEAREGTSKKACTHQQALHL
jgi:hypothetical protein